MKQGTAAVQTSIVREFLQIISAQAKAALAGIDAPGFLQLSRLHPGNEILVPSRYMLDAIELMVEAAVTDSDAGHNVYIEGRTLLQATTRGERGTLNRDTVAIFALVVDSDADKQMGWTPTVRPSLTVATSPGNFQYWFFLKEAVSAEVGKALGERIRKVVKSDHDTGNPAQPYRVAGTVNYPNANKIARGRVTVPTQLVEFAPEVLWTPEEIEAVFPLSERKSDDGGASGGTADESGIPADTMQVIRDGVPEAEHPGRTFFNIILVLKRLGWSLDNIIALLEQHPNGIAKKFRGRLRQETQRAYGKIEIKPDSKPTPDAGPPFLPKAEFLAGFVPPDYIVDGVIQRRFIYSLTGRTGGGKTAIALALARAVACADPGATFGTHGAEKGHVVYFVGENPDDVRMRLIGADSRRSDPDADRISFVVGVFNIEEMRAHLVSEAQRVGGIDLVLVDTSAAYFLSDDENNNPQMGAHARMLRSLTTLPGGPCVVVLCHPIKYATDPSQLLPRGGGAFLAEVDGNLTAWRHDENLIDLHHTDKFRGPGFEPITFRIEKVTTTKLVDSKNRLLPTVEAVAITEAEEEQESSNVRHDEDRVLVALLINADRSIADLARSCGFILANGEPHKSRMHRRLKRLKEEHLVKETRGVWRLTKEGREAAEALHKDDEEETVADRGGANSKRDFFAVRGAKLGKTVPCIHCHVADGNVYKIKDGRLPKGKGHAEALHEGCAKDWFEGKPSPEPDPEPDSELPLH